MAFPYERSKEIVALIRSIRGFLTESRPLESPGPQTALQKFIQTDSASTVPVKTQAEQDEAFADLTALMEVAVPFWLSQLTHDKVTTDVGEVVGKLGEKYLDISPVAFVNQLIDSVDEIGETLESLGISDTGALRHWFLVNELKLEPVALSKQDVILSPLSTDYVVAHFYLHTLGKLSDEVPTLHPVGWMPHMQEVTLSSLTRQAIKDAEGKLLVMLDESITGTTRIGVRRAVEKMFVGKKVFFH